ncbi:hypothetical protein Ancab_020811 [Ancistrocladus abbreviatus]
MGRGCTDVSHLLYADDLFLFTKATKHAAIVILDLFGKMEKWLGLTINKSKSGIFSNGNVPKPALSTSSLKISQPELKGWKSTSLSFAANGNHIKHWNDPWVPNVPLQIPYPCVMDIWEDLHKSDLIIADRRWNLNLINDLFEANTVARVAEIPIRSRGEDKLIWKHDLKGIFLALQYVVS